MPQGESSSSRLAPPSHEVFGLLSPEVYWVYTRMAGYAAETAWHLRQAWARPVRHNRRIERGALWEALLLDAECRRALAPDPLQSLLSPPTGSLDARYELQAGIRVVPHILPFTLDERQRLRPTGVRDFRFGTEDIVNREPEVVERWHNWVWMDTEREPQKDVKALGASALLAEAGTRISDSLYEILGWDKSKS
jgi:hypothetical protein